MKVEAGKVMYCKTSVANYVQDVTAAVSGDIDMLYEVERLQHFQEIDGRFTVSVINV